MSSTIYLISLPSTATPQDGEPENGLPDWLIKNLELSSRRDLTLLSVPNFKIGTLDNLIQQSEELAKYDGQFQAVFSKVAEVVDHLYENNSVQARSVKLVDNVPAEEYLREFSWSTRKYRVDRPISEIVDMLTKEVLAYDADVRAAASNYSNAKTTLASTERKQTGNLSVRSLHDVVRKEDFVQDSEYLCTVLVAVPNSSLKDFLNTYERLSPMVVPRSASQISRDEDFSLYGVTTFKKYAHEFAGQARDKKWVPRDFVYSDTLVSDLRQEFTAAKSDEKRLWTEASRLARIAYSDVFKALAHLKTLRVFVESVLRYGLPPDFETYVIKPSPSLGSKTEDILVGQFGYLGGGAFARDSRGRIKTDASDLHEYGALVDHEYKPFVLFTLHIS